MSLNYEPSSEPLHLRSDAFGPPAFVNFRIYANFWEADQLRRGVGDAFRRALRARLHTHTPNQITHTHTPQIKSHTNTHTKSNKHGTRKSNQSEHQNESNRSHSCSFESLMFRLESGNKEEQEGKKVESEGCRIQDSGLRV